MSLDATRKLTRENLKDLPPLCTDGAWGTELIKLGIELGQMCDRWNLEHPEWVGQVARAYVEAGADIILSNTFSGNRTVLARHGLDARGADINRAGTEISKRAAAGRAYVFASAGPTGLMPMIGQGDSAQIEEIYAEQAAALETGGADAIVIETMTDVMEAEAAVRGALGATRIPVGVSFTFDSGQAGAFTMMGVGVAQACDAAARSGASFVGANCGRGIATFIEIARAFARCPGGLPVWIKGNAGLPERDPATGRVFYGATPEVYTVAVGPLLEAGVKFIGGCCGSTPEHIRAIATAMRR